MGLGFSLAAELELLVPEEPPVLPPNAPRPGVNLGKAQIGDKPKFLQNKRPDQARR